MTIVEGIRRVLVADDDSAIREMLSVNLEMLGFLVTQVADGEDALPGRPPDGPRADRPRPDDAGDGAQRPA
jgi:FixJ family two-component response regulator